LGVSTKMTNEQLKEFLKQNLNISVEVTEEFGPKRVIHVTLSLCNEVISTDEVDLGYEYALSLL